MLRTYPNDRSRKLGNRCCPLQRQREGGRERRRNVGSWGEIDLHAWVKLHDLMLSLDPFFLLGLVVCGEMVRGDPLFLLIHFVPMR